MLAWRTEERPLVPPKPQGGGSVGKAFDCGSARDLAGSWVRAPRRALCGRLGAWSPLRVLCLPLSAPPLLTLCLSVCLSLSLSQKLKMKTKNEQTTRGGHPESSLLFPLSSQELTHRSEVRSKEGVPSPQNRPSPGRDFCPRLPKAPLSACCHSPHTLYTQVAYTMHLKPYFERLLTSRLCTQYRCVSVLHSDATK